MNHATIFTKVCHYYLTPKKHVLNYFALEMAAHIFAIRRHHREQRSRGFFTTHFNLFGMPEKHIIRTYSMPDHVIFKLLACNPSFFDLQFFSMYCDFFILYLRLH